MESNAGLAVWALVVVDEDGKTIAATYSPSMPHAEHWAVEVASQKHPEIS